MILCFNITFFDVKLLMLLLRCYKMDLAFFDNIISLVGDKSLYYN